MAGEDVAEDTEEEDGDEDFLVVSGPVELAGECDLDTL